VKPETGSSLPISGLWEARGYDTIEMYRALYRLTGNINYRKSAEEAERKYLPQIDQYVLVKGAPGWKDGDYIVAAVGMNGDIEITNGYTKKGYIKKSQYFPTTKQLGTVRVDGKALVHGVNGVKDGSYIVLAVGRNGDVVISDGYTLRAYATKYQYEAPVK
jgi:hypothetical protein